MRFFTVLVALAAIIGHAAKHSHPRRHFQKAVASYYRDDGFATASGRHYTYGFASLIFGNEWGKRVLFCYARCVIGRLDDHGPYVAGRTFDFDERLASATGLSQSGRGVVTVRWTPIRRVLVGRLK